MGQPPADRNDRIARLLAGSSGIVNLGLESFAEMLLPFEVPVIHVEWQPPAGGDPELARLLRALEGEEREG